MMETFQDFWVEEDLGSDHRAIIATFSSQPLTHDKPKKKILLYHKADWTAINNTIQYNNERNDRIGLNAGKTAQIFFPGKCHTSEKNIKHVNQQHKRTNLQQSKISRSHIRLVTHSKHTLT